MIALILAAFLAAVPVGDFDVRALGAPALWIYPDIDWATVDRVGFITPAPLAAITDVPEPEAEGCVNRVGHDTFLVCAEGQEPSGPHVILAGDSKALQWHPAIAPIAVSSGWRLTTLVYSACPLTASGLPLNGEPYAPCEAWIPRAVDFVLESKPDLLIVSGGRNVTYPPGSPATETTTAAMTDGYATMWEQFVRAGIPVVVIVDNPAPDKEMWECAAHNPASLSRCTFTYPADRTDTPASVLRAAAARVPEVKLVDLTPWICPRLEACPAVIGNVMVYRRGTHLTRTYVASLRSLMDRALGNATAGLLGTPSPA